MNVSYSKGFVIIKVTKILMLVGTAVIVAMGSCFLKATFEFTITDDEMAISKSISKLAEASVQIKQIKNIDNKKIVLFTIGDEIGESEFTKGPNSKLKIESAGHGSDNVRIRVMTTSEGQYIRALGKNKQNLKKLVIYMDEVKKQLEVPDGEYFVTWIALNKHTDRTFPQGSVWYDKNGNEVFRIGETY
jgi:uncharacterized membrane protein YdbT with pleckstrin-like domain